MYVLVCEFSVHEHHSVENDMAVDFFTEADNPTPYRVNKVSSQEVSEYTLYGAFPLSEVKGWWASVAQGNLNRATRVPYIRLQGLCNTLPLVPLL